MNNIFYFQYNSFIFDLYSCLTAYYIIVFYLKYIHFLSKSFKLLHGITHIKLNMGMSYIKE